MIDCSDTQEKIARGEPLTAPERGHAVGCALCLPAVAAYSLLDDALNAVASEVPPGFADRVMARLAREEEAAAEAQAGRARPPLRWFERRWGQLTLTHAAALIALLNVARFLASILVPGVASGAALGGSP